MCGLAGYSANKEVVTKFLPEDGMKNILREGWLHNLHRGVDAVGFFGFKVENDELDIFKQPGTAIEILVDEVDKDDFELDPMYTFAMHTRAYTIGSPDKNENNHPVSYGGVTVTHNGHITNYAHLRNQLLSKVENEKFPDVDSAVIPLVLSKFVDGPFDVAGIAKALKMLTGAFSIHAVWSAYPGISLFARGTGRPFVFAELKGQMLAYASEDEGLWSIINAMGINPNVNFDWWELDTEHFMVVDAGEIVKWGSFRSQPFSNNSKRQKTKRWLPRESGRKRTLVYETDSDFDFANKAESTSLRFKKKTAQLIYTRGEGFTVNTYPVSSAATLPGILSEADEVYSEGDFLYAFYGDVELVLDKSRIVKDIFNHSLFKNNQRFTVEKKKTLFKDGVPGASLDLKDFIHLRTSQVKAPPTERAQYAYVEKWERAAAADKAEEERKNNPKALPQRGFVALANRANGSSALIPMGTNGTTSSDDDDDETDETLRPEIVQAPVELTWENFWAEAVIHQQEPLFFLGDKMCPQHGQMFTEHGDVEGCKVLLNAASYALSACSSIELYQVADPSIRITYSKSSNYCQDEGDKQCQWVPAEFAKVTNKYVSWLVRTSERCLHCDTWRELEQEPKWFGKLNIADRLRIANGEKRFANAD